MRLIKVLKRSILCTVLVASVAVAAGCGNKAENTEEATETTEDVTKNQAEKAESDADLSNIKIDYKTSELYSKEDMNEAIKLIVEEFNTWEGCTLYDISYTDDEKCEDNLSYINSLAVDKKYDQCIVFNSNFHSPKEGGGAWEPDYDYENWQWFLGRTEGGKWDLLTWGY